MRLYAEQGILFLREGDTLIHKEPVASPSQLPFATTMIMSHLFANACKMLTIEGVCIWHVTTRKSLEEVLVPLFEVI